MRCIVEGVRRAAILLLLVLPSVGEESQAPEVLLAPRWKAPEETSTSLTLERRTTAEGDLLHGAAASVERLRIVYGEKVDAVEKGRRSGLRRKYVRYQTRTETIFGAGGLAPVTIKHPIAGRVFRFLRDKSGRLLPTKPLPLDADGAPPLPAADWEELLPGRAVKVGSSWNTERAATLRRLLGIEFRKVVCTLKAFDKRTGKATIGLALHREGEGRVRYSFEGAMVFSTRLGKVVHLELKGTLTRREGKGAIETGVKLTSDRRVASGK